MAKPVLHLDVLCYEEEGHYIARCLQFNLIAEADSYSDVMEDIKDLIKAHIEFAEENNNSEYLFNPAPAKYWSMLRKAIERDQLQNTEDCELDKKHPIINIEKFLNNSWSLQSVCA